MSGEPRCGTKPELFLVTRSPDWGMASRLYSSSDGRKKSRYEKRGQDWVEIRDQTDQVIAGTAGASPANAPKARSLWQIASKSFSRLALNGKSDDFLAVSNNLLLNALLGPAEMFPCNRTSSFNCRQSTRRIQTNHGATQQTVAQCRC